MPTSPARTTTVVVIGAGQAGLSMSRHLTDRSIEHVVLERHQVAHSWRAERWDSLRLLTPNWLTRLPGAPYAGDDPDGFMTAADVVDQLAGYRSSIAAPVVEHAAVSAVEPDGDRFTVTSSSGPWDCRAVVVASGAASIPRRPELAPQLPPNIAPVDSVAYRNPDQLAVGRVLVVGASASGLQIADELQRSGRDVTLSVGDHVRLPRTYRGMDIHWWMDTLGVLDERWDEVEDLGRARRLPSLQLIGTPERRDLDLNSLSRDGVDIVGRLAAIRDRRGLCSGGLENLCRSADLKQQRLLDRIDAYATERSLDGELAEPERPEPTRLPTPATQIDLTTFGTVVWATGFRVDHRWIDARIRGGGAILDHDGGVGRHPGIYTIGLPFQRRRSSTFLSGVGADAGEIAGPLASYLDLTSVSRRR
jgi:putative flavoprotein involved in K+ transport